MINYNKNRKINQLLLSAFTTPFEHLWLEGKNMRLLLSPPLAGRIFDKQNINYSLYSYIKFCRCPSKKRILYVIDYRRS